LTWMYLRQTICKKMEKFAKLPWINILILGHTFTVSIKWLLPHNDGGKDMSTNSKNANNANNASNASNGMGKNASNASNANNSKNASNANNAKNASNASNANNSKNCY